MAGLERDGEVLVIFILRCWTKPEVFLAERGSRKLLFSASEAIQRFNVNVLVLSGGRESYR